MSIRMSYELQEYDMDVNVTSEIKNEDTLAVAFAKFLMLTQYAGYHADSWDDILREFVSDENVLQFFENYSIYDWAADVLNDYIPLA